MGVAPSFLAVAWVVFEMLARLPDPFWLISVLSIIFLLPVQMTANEINLVTSPNHDPNSKFSGWNIVAVIGGGLLFLLALVGTFFPSK